LSLFDEVSDELSNALSDATPAVPAEVGARMRLSAVSVMVIPGISRTAASGAASAVIGVLA
jgi:hypothetical protein